MLEEPSHSLLETDVFLQLRPNLGCFVPICRKILEFFPLEFSASKISLNLWCLSNDTSVDIYINIEKCTIVLCLKACFYGLGLSNGDFFWHP